MGLRAGNKYKELAQRNRRPQKQITKPMFMPPLQGGINAMAGAANIPPTDALRMINMVPGEYGVFVRRGYREHCPPVPAGTGIRTFMPFASTSDTVDNSKLFVATNDGIYDATLPNTTPVKVLDWPIKAGNAGYCSWHNYQTAAAPFLLVADGENGYWIYNGNTVTWAAATLTGTGPTAAQVDFVTVWKNHVWLVQRSTSRAAYLETGIVQGNILGVYDFGNKFRYGGNLKGLWNWTLDGGEGVDDYLVAVGSSGDVLVFKGVLPDPDDQQAFGLHGSFWIGQPPRGRRIADDFGGDLLLMSAYGLVQLSKLIGGAPLQNPEAQLSYKVNPRISTLMETTSHLHGWEVKLHPRDQLIFINTPKVSGYPYFQFVFHTLTRAWTVFNGLPIQTSETFRTKLMMGDENNRIYTYDGHTDKVMLADAGATSQSIEWEQFGSFQGYGSQAVFKRVQLLRPQFVGDRVPVYQIAPRYDFDLSPLPGSPAVVPPGDDTWDHGLWDGAHWSGGYIVNQPPYGAFGVGRHVAIQMRGRSSGETIHVGTDVMYDAGGIL